jgi:hypothetical protein
MREMLRHCALLLLTLAAPTLAQQLPTEASMRVNPAAARSLFERDWVLMNWALKFYDADRDILLSPIEAQRAADAFRSMADTNGDGRVTTQEYGTARAFILARY